MNTFQYGNRQILINCREDREKLKFVIVIHSVTLHFPVFIGIIWKFSLSVFWRKDTDQNTRHMDDNNVLRETDRQFGCIVFLSVALLG